MGKVFFFEELSWKKAEELQKASDFFLFPFASFEQHGFHLPLSTDALIGKGILKIIKELIEQESIELVIGVYPSVPYGMSLEHSDFPGTISASRKTYIGLIIDIATAVSQSHCRNIVLFNAHGGNTSYVHVAAREIREKTPLLPVILDLYSGNVIKKYSDELDYHAGKLETSMMMYLYPEQVGSTELYPDEWTPEKKHKVYGSGAVPWKSGEFSPSGVIGNPGGADKAFGEFIVYEIARECITLLLAVKESISDNS